MDLLDGEDDEPLLEPARDTQVGSGRLVDEVNINFQVGRKNRSCMIIQLQIKRYIDHRYVSIYIYKR